MNVVGDYFVVIYASSLSKNLILPKTVAIWKTQHALDISCLQADNFYWGSREMETIVGELMENDLDLKATTVLADLGLGLELLLSSCRLTKGMLGCPHVLHQHVPGCL